MVNVNKILLKKTVSHLALTIITSKPVNLLLVLHVHHVAHRTFHIL